MGQVEIDIRIENPESKEAMNVKALVDTGATFTILPQHVASNLRLKPVGEKVTVATAKGEDSLDLTHALIQVDSKRRIVPVLISDHLDRVLLGVIALEAVQMSVNPTTGKLEEHAALLY